jgi:hypothetical protein
MYVVNDCGILKKEDIKIKIFMLVKILLALKKLIDKVAYIIEGDKKNGN